jgi:hypothetical protein
MQVPNWLGFGVLGVALAVAGYSYMQGNPGGGSPASNAGASGDAPERPAPDPDRDRAPAPSPVVTPAPSPPPAPAPQQRALYPNLSGLWTGSYSGGGNRTTNFEVLINANGASITGRMTETNTFQNATSAKLYAQIIGEVSANGAVQFTKTYDGTGGATHSVYYRGQVVGDMISGTWTLENLNGQFRMSR